MYQLKKNLITLNTNLNQTMELFKQRPKNSHNIKSHAVEVTSPNSGWHGGTVADLTRDPDMMVFIKARSALERQGLQKFQSQAPINRRKRTLSEHDGDFDLDRRWDFQPFITAKKLPVSMPHIEILCDFSIASYYKSYDIDRYGALTWAITQILEARGINTTVKLFHNSYTVTATHNYEANILIKDAKTYISAQAMARVFRSNFKRRVMHHQLIMAADFVNMPVSYGLGRPKQFPKPVEYKSGVLKLAIQSIQSFDDLKKELENII